MKCTSKVFLFAAVFFCAFGLAHWMALTRILVFLIGLPFSWLAVSISPLVSDAIATLGYRNEGGYIETILLSLSVAFHVYFWSWLPQIAGRKRQDDATIR